MHGRYVHQNSKNRK